VQPLLDAVEDETHSLVRTPHRGVAGQRFLAHGYAAATIPAIASDADVSVQAIYKAFGNKARLFKAVFDVAVSGDDTAAPIADRSWIGEITGEPNPSRKLHLYARWLAAAMPRAGPIQLVARAAAAVDPEVEVVWRQMGAERLEGMNAFAAHLAAGGHLRNGLAVEHARDVLWTYNSVELYELLVIERDWSVERYREFIAEALTVALLPRE
jgi:AcrR family transcriptional regulator